MIPVIYMDLIDDAESLIEFEEIYHTYRKRMFYVANTVLQDAHEAEDAVQDAFIGIARNKSTVRKIREAEDLGNYVLEFSVKETAETLQLKPAAVKQRLVRGKKLLLKALGQPEEDGNE